MKKNFSQALTAQNPLQIGGTINAYCALLAQQAGFQAIYLSGAGVANASHGLPDLGMTSLNDVCEDVRRITSVCDLPLLVDADTGWGHAFNIARTVKELTRSGAAALHLEDQRAEKRCGHRPGKALVSPSEMCDRIKAATYAKIDPEFWIIARTDAIAVEGLQSALSRATLYAQAGADAIFAEAVTDPSDYQKFADACQVPILANMTEFGKSPLLTAPELATHGVSLILYPLSAFRAMNLAATHIYQTIIQNGTQASQLKNMQTRDQLYTTLNYHSYEQALDRLTSPETK